MKIVLIHFPCHKSNYGEAVNTLNMESSKASQWWHDKFTFLLEREHNDKKCNPFTWSSTSLSLLNDHPPACLFWMIIQQPFSSEWSSTSLSPLNDHPQAFFFWIIIHQSFSSEWSHSFPNVISGLSRLLSKILFESKEA